MTYIVPSLCLLLSACNKLPAPDDTADTNTQNDAPPQPEPKPVLPDQSKNLLQNPSLESPTPRPWFDMTTPKNSWHPLALSTTQAHTGTQSAQLTIDHQITTLPKPTAILGIVQEIPATSPTLPPTFPNTISGYYKVTNWTRATKNQYLQTVIMATRPQNKPAGTNYPTYQLAIPLAGITEPPFQMGNRKFAFAPHNSPQAEPTLNQWIHFEFNLHELYQHHWGFIPENSTSYKVFFEVRYDKKSEDQHPQATVYFDDLYLGPTPSTD